ncbi:D-lyxose/D-mannose family sugar isomerase [Anaerolineae bacterium CFX7]|nr:D-lyxose/D-mannose family sugar isomerase [Anaerolineae bacterium CFX7]
MKRSEINAILRQGDAFFKQHQFHLPPFAYWTPDEWRARGPEANEIAAHMLGWDITDFGGGAFDKQGLFLFTVRNGDAANLKRGAGKLYAEKIMIVQANQVTPMHLHRVKVEDIINRGGGDLVIQLYNSTPDGKLADTPITVSTDGVERTLHAGAQVTLAPGESITLPTGLYHAFWGAREKVLVGEVSLVNDDHTDNFFYEPVGRFPTIQEDEPPLYLLVGDYAKYYNGKK